MMASMPLHPLPAGPVDLTAISTRKGAGLKGGKKKGKKALADLGEELADLQERLYAEGTAGPEAGARTRSVLLVLQGMDTSGKGGIQRHVLGLVEPQGVRLTSFKAPTDEERDHDFLWRIRKGLPGPGMIGVFDRSHYEDVLIARVRSLAGAAEIERRYEAINEFEAQLVASGTRVVKCMLHISADTQKERLLARLDDPTKRWKFNPGDITERELWPAYREAYEIALERTDTEAAPWYVVPSDRKWYRNLAVATLLRDALADLDPQWPPADYDVDQQRQRLADEAPLG